MLYFTESFDLLFNASEFNSGLYAVASLSSLGIFLAGQNRLSAHAGLTMSILYIYQSMRGRRGRPEHAISDLSPEGG